MSRAGVIYGSFTIEGSGALSWTPEDEERRAGRFVHVFRDGTRAVQPPHGPFFFGTVRPLSPGRRCDVCKARKVRTNRAGRDFCFGCGAGGADGEWGISPSRVGLVRSGVDDGRTG